MYKLKLKHHFDSAHKLNNYNGACANLHGHRWEIEVEITTDELKNDMIIDFKELKAIINELDHSYLNEKVDFNPTAENISKYLQNKIAEKVDGVVDVTIWESPEASITFLEDERYEI